MIEEIMSDEDLLELKVRLERRLEYLQEASYKIQKGMKEMGTLKLQDNADIISTQTQIRVQDSMVSQHLNEMKEIESSLRKFESGEYGICEMCEGDIGIERLNAKPHARFCINCREIFEKRENHKKFRERS